MIGHRPLVAVLVALGACYSFTPPDGLIPCSRDRECPAGQQCAADDICYDLDSTLNDDATLANLGLSVGALEPEFDPIATSYRVRLGLGAESIAVTPTATASNGVVIEISQSKLASGQSSEAIALGLGATVIEVLVTAASGSETRYELTIERGAGIGQRAYMKASNADPNDQFGFAVSLDGNSLAIGAFGEAAASTGVGGNQESNELTGIGAVYIFVRTGTVWSQQIYLKASSLGQNGFGFAVDLDGDTLVVGAPGESSNATGVNGDETNTSSPGSGAAYVFVRNGATWSQQAYLKASNTGFGDRFGSTVSVSGDTVVVGAEGENSDSRGINSPPGQGAGNSGSVYVFRRTGTLWAQEAYVKSSNSDASDEFGSSVAIDGDLLIVGADGEASVATGANGDQQNNGAADAGAAYVFVRSGSAWAQEAYLKASNTESGDSFGTSVAIDSETVVIGATGESSDSSGVDGDDNNTATGAGAAYVFRRTNGAWSQEAYVKASNPDSFDRFGTSVDLADDLLLVGAIGEASLTSGANPNQADNGDQTAGAAYLFGRNGSVWTQLAYLKSLHPDGGIGNGSEPNSGGDSFGQSVGVASGVVVVGADREASLSRGLDGDQEDDSSIQVGAAYVFE